MVEFIFKILLFIDSVLIIIADCSQSNYNSINNKNFNWTDNRMDKNKTDWVIKFLDSVDAGLLTIFDVLITQRYHTITFSPLNKHMCGCLSSRKFIGFIQHFVSLYDNKLCNLKKETILYPKLRMTDSHAYVYALKEALTNNWLKQF